MDEFDGDASSPREASGTPLSRRTGALSPGATVTPTGIRYLEPLSGNGSASGSSDSSKLIVRAVQQRTGLVQSAVDASRKEVTQRLEVRVLAV